MTPLTAALLAIGAGVLVAFQSAILGGANRELTPMGAAIWVHVGGLAFLAALALITRRGFEVEAFRAVPWVVLGGVCGAGIVAAIGAVISPLGLAVTLTLVTGSQLIVGALLDAAGVSGRVIAVTPARVGGVLLIVVGAWLLFSRS